MLFVNRTTIVLQQRVHFQCSASYFICNPYWLNTCDVRVIFISVMTSLLGMYQNEYQNVIKKMIMYFTVQCSRLAYFIITQCAISLHFNCLVKLCCYYKLRYLHH